MCVSRTLRHRRSKRPHPASREELARRGRCGTELRRRVRRGQCGVELRRWVRTGRGGETPPCVASSASLLRSPPRLRMLLQDPAGACSPGARPETAEPEAKPAAGHTAAGDPHPLFESARGALAAPQPVAPWSVLRSVEGARFQGSWRSRSRRRWRPRSLQRSSAVPVRRTSLLSARAAAAVLALSSRPLFRGLPRSPRARHRGTRWAALRRVSGACHAVAAATAWVEVARLRSRRPHS
mmetsp:Transcript_56713/g.122081  ORF Transcript_56713/g.122081 Transcript_56713/m.122081 type:complete len:239 (-) Transcript_56713:184-900(-)